MNCNLSKLIKTHRRNHTLLQLDSVEQQHVSPEVLPSGICCKHLDGGRDWDTPPPPPSWIPTLLSLAILSGSQVLVCVWAFPPDAPTQLLMATVLLNLQRTKLRIWMCRTHFMTRMYPAYMTTSTKLSHLMKTKVKVEEWIYNEIIRIS